MTRPHIRSTPRRRGCGCALLAFLAALTLLISAAAAVALFAPGIVLRLFTFDSRGDVEQFWQTLESQTTDAPAPLPESLFARLPTSTPPMIAAAPTSAPTPEPLPTQSAAPPTDAPPTETPTPTATPVNPYHVWFRYAEAPSTVFVIAEGYMDLSFNRGGLFANAAWVGESHLGKPLGIVEFAEEALPLLCATYFNGCRTPLYRVDRVDFRPGGMVLYGSINAGVQWQQVGLALRLNEDRRTLALAGIVLNGEVFAPPTSGRLADILNDAIGRGNQALQVMRLESPPYDLRLSEIWFSDGLFVAVME